MKRTALVLAALSIVATCAIPAEMSAQTREESTVQATVTEILTPDYISPSELVKFLGASEVGGTLYFFRDAMNHSGPVQLRLNDAANVVMLTGKPTDVSIVRELAKSADVPPRQIIIETQIIEIDQKRLDDLGVDWEDLLRSSNPNVSYSRNSDRLHSKTEARNQSTDRLSTEQTNTQSIKRTQINASLRIDQFLNIIAENRAGTIRNAPRIVTINNRPAKILDGERVTYVTRYSSFTNLFETQTMDAGLILSATPSIGKSGFITMNVTAELTSLVLSCVSSDYISRSIPCKTLVDNSSLFNQLH